MGDLHSARAQRPFRFGVVLQENISRKELIERARKIEKLGYNILLLPDHFKNGELSPTVALMCIAGATTRIRIGSFVFNNDLRPPAVLAKDVATLDLLSEGRFELGIGSGYRPDDYDQAGLALDTAGQRIERLKEAIQIIKYYFITEKVNFKGTYYTIQNLQTEPHGIQRPHPPIYIGGGGQRVLKLAAREANIVGLAALAKADGSLDFTTITQKATIQKISWIEESAGKRLNEIEINCFVFLCRITRDKTSVASHIANHLGSVTTEDIITSPHYLIGTKEEITQNVYDLRTIYGISSITIPFTHAEAFAEIIAHIRSQRQ